MRKEIEKEIERKEGIGEYDASILDEMIKELEMQKNRTNNQMHWKKKERQRERET